MGAGGRRTVLALDSYERFGLLDTWLRDVFLPRLPGSVITVIAGRDAPGPWMTSPGWSGLVAELPLEPLRQSESIALLRRRGLDELGAARANRFAQGHPLALELAAAALLADPDRDIASGPPPAVIRQLLDAVLAGLPDRAHRDAGGGVHVAEGHGARPARRCSPARACARTSTPSPALPFVERTPEGLMIHDVVREALAADLRERDPERHATYRRRAWAVLRDPGAHPHARAALERHRRSDLPHPEPRAARRMLPGGVGGTPRGARRPGRRARDPRDHRPPRAARRRRAARRLAPAPRPRASRWPGDRTARWPPSCISRRSATSTRRCVDADPVGRAWVDHMAAVPPRDGDRVLTMRRWLGRDSGEMLSPAVGVCWLDVKRTYMELRPRLSRLYSAMADPAPLAPIFTPLGFAPVGAPVDVGGGVLHQPVWLDFGEGSVDGWLRRLVGGEITGEEAAAAELAEGAAGARLSPREIEVLGLIADGRSNRAIAARLVISEKTAGRHPTRRHRFLPC